MGDVSEKSRAAIEEELEYLDKQTRILDEQRKQLEKDLQAKSQNDEYFEICVPGVVSCLGHQWFDPGHLEQDGYGKWTILTAETAGPIGILDVDEGAHRYKLHFDQLIDVNNHDKPIMSVTVFSVQGGKMASHIWDRPEEFPGCQLNFFDGDDFIEMEIYGG